MRTAQHRLAAIKQVFDEGIEGREDEPPMTGDRGARLAYAEGPRGTLGLWPAVMLYLVIFMTCYGSVLADYGIWDDYSDILRTNAASRIAEGRPFHAFGLWLFTLWADEIEDLSYVRLFGILGTTFLAWTVFRLLVRSGGSRFQSFCVGAIMCTTLPFQVYVAWASASYFLVAAIVSGFAFSLADRAFETRHRYKKWILALGASLVLSAGLAVYQPSGMFFWVFAAVILFSRQRELRDLFNHFAWYCTITMIGLFLGFIIAKLGVMVVHQGKTGRINFIEEPMVKLMWFLLDAFPNALNFALLSPSSLLFPSYENATVSSGHQTADVVIAWMIFAVISSGLFMYFRGTCKERICKYLISLAVLIITYMPNLVSNTNYSAYRTLSSLSAVVVLYVYFAFQGYSRQCSFASLRVNAVMGSVAIICILSAAYHVRTYFVIHHVRELALMRSELARKEPSRIQAIYVYPPEWGFTAAPLVKNEFGQLSSFSKPISTDMIQLLLRSEPGWGGLERIRSADPLDPPRDTDENLIVDMRKLGFIPPAPHNWVYIYTRFD